MSAPAVPERQYPRQRTYGRRTRSIGELRRGNYDRLSPLWGLPAEGPLFGEGDVSDVVLDIGFGWGTALVDLALRNPDQTVIGVEVHQPGVTAVLEAIETHDLRNVRVAEADVHDIVARIRPAALAGVRVWFPDPWPKRRQHVRRLIQPAFVARLAECLRVDGVLHLATDIAEYAEHMERVCSADPDLRGGVVPRPEWRPVTAYEQKGLDAGRPAVDLVYRRV